MQQVLALRREEAEISTKSKSSRLLFPRELGPVELNVSAVIFDRSHHCFQSPHYNGTIIC